MTTVYTWDDAGVYAGPLDLDQSYADPLEPGLINLPRNATRAKPPSTADREAAVISADGKTWTVVPDWRGLVYWLTDRTQHRITALGIEPPAGWLPADPGPSLDDVRESQTSKIVADCEEAIVAGFESSALGQPHTYPCKLTDQANLIASVSASREPGLPETWRAPFWCQDASGEWSYQLHTAEQIRQVGMDGYSATLTKLQRKTALEAAIKQASTIEQVQAITWSTRNPDQPET